MPIDKRELMAALKDSTVLNYIRSQVLQNASSMTIGRFPGNGSAENDNWPYRDACDATHPFNADYVIPKNFQRIISAKLSFILRPYRTYSTLTLSNPGNASVDHTHATGGETGHSHAHGHSLHVAATGSPSNAVLFGSGLNLGDTTNPVPYDTAQVVNSDGGTGSSGHNHGNTGGQSQTHTHSVSGTTTLGIAEDVAPSNPGITIAFDGVDRTTALGGPFNANMVEIDVTSFLPTAIGVPHVVSLQPNQRATITAMLRISYAVDSRLAQ